MEQTEKSVAAMFDRIAPRYDAMNRLISGMQDQRWRKALLERVPVIPNGCYVDVATGTGDVLNLIMTKVCGPARFVGIDVSERMLSVANDKLANNHTINFELFCRSAEALQLPDQSVDCLTISFGLRNVINKRQGIEEFRRVLKPGGHLLILDIFPPEASLLARCYRFYFRYVMPKMAALVSDRAAYQYLPDSVDTFYRSSELQAVLADKQFSVKKIKKFMFGGVLIFHAIKK